MIKRENQEIKRKCKKVWHFCESILHCQKGRSDSHRDTQEKATIKPHKPIINNLPVQFFSVQSFLALPNKKAWSMVNPKRD